jgi:hypothetical protein
LYEGTFTKPAALAGLEEETPSASASSAAIPSVKGVATLFLLLSPEETARASGGAEGTEEEEGAEAAGAAAASGVARAEEG